jgi:hypothetical protein
MPTQRRTPGRKSDSVRLWLQALEDRTVPAGLGWADLGVMPAALSGAPSNFNFTSQRNVVMDTDALWAAFTTAPSEQDVWAGAAQGLSIELPRPDGTTARFAIADSPIMAPELAAQFPEIRTWSAQGLDDPGAVARIAMTPLGFDAVVLSPSTGAWSITPYYNLETQYYVSFFQSNVHFDPERLKCGCALCTGATNSFFPDSSGEEGPTAGYGGGGTAAGGGAGGGSSGSGDTGGAPPTAGRSGLQLRTYRMAVAATGEFTQAHGGNVAGGLAGVVVDVNQMNAIYENDFSIRLQLVANNNSIIYTDSNNDPYSNGNHGTMLGQNQSNLDSVIGSANYDIGHVFGFGNGGGLAGLGVVGNNSRKGQAVSEDVSFIPNYMGMSVGPHEVGHQFNANHTFNSSNDSNRNAATAYENGSGATIMSYAGLISGDNYISGNFAAFNASAFDEVIRFVDTTIPTVGIRTATGNAVPSVSAGNDFVIPARSFFELVATASDANANDALTYSWEQRDLGPAALHTDADNGSSPLFRVFPASPSPSRYFPQLSDILNNTNTAGEQLFTRNRTSNFRVTVRDNRAGGGAVNTDDVTLTVVDTGAPFRLTAPNTAVSWTGKTSQTVTWNVAGTTGNGINAANVRIRLSIDGGLTYPITVLSSTANDGSETITVPNVDTTQARLRVEGVNNVFFDISDTNFTIVGVPGVIVSPVGGLTTTEAGGTATFTVRLETRPTGIVSIPISSSDLSEGTVSAAVLTFTTSNWNTPQTVTITGVDDLLVDGDVAYQIVTGKASSSDSRYNNMVVADVDVVNINDDFAGFEVVSGNTVTTEKGATASFTVRLITAPTADVVLPLSTSNTAEGSISPASLTFTPSNWDVAQTVTVAGVDDTVVDADVPYFAVLGVATSADTEYAGLDPDDISLINRNDDTSTTVVALGSNFRYAQTVNFRATVSGFNGRPADGKVTFTSGALNLGTFPVVAGIANMGTAVLPLNTSTVTATFSSDSFFLDSSGNTSVNILPALLNVSANARTKTYGAAMPSLTYTATGFVDGENASIFTGALATTGAANSNVGTYPISLGNLSAGPKYEIVFTGNSLNVTKANLTVTAQPAAKVYGDALPPLTYTPACFVNGDTATIMTGSLTTSASASSNVGVYPIQQGNVAAGGNYNINYNGASLAITPASLTVTPNAQTKQYGPAAVPALTFNTTGFVNGDTTSILTGGLTTTALATSPVGTYPILPGTLAAVGGNYNLGVLPANVTITPAPLSVAAINATARLGAPIPAFNYGVSGLVNGDKATVVSGVVLSTPATPDVTKGTYPIVVTGGTASNYTITHINGVLTLTLAATLVGEDEFTVGTDGGSGVVTQYNASGSPINSFFPYPDFNGAVRTATGDVTGDGVPDVIVGTGPGTLAAVRVIDGATGGILQDIFPFEDFTGGVFIAVGDMTGDGKSEFVITPDVGGGPRVTIYRGGTLEPMLNFFGIDDQNFRGGARAALGDINGDGATDLIIAAGFGGGPRISLLDGKQLSNNNIHGFLTSDFYAFSDALRDGVYVTAGDVNGDGFADVIIGAGPGGGPRVLVISGRTILDEGGPVATRKPVANFFAGDPNSRNGVFVSARNLDDDAKSDLVIGGGSVAIGYRGSSLANGQAVPMFFIDADTGPTGGVFVG